MFGDVLVAQSLERHPDNLIPLLGNHLFFCRSVRYVLPPVIFTSKHTLQIEQPIPQTYVGLYVMFSSRLPSTLLTFGMLSVKEEVSHCSRGTFRIKHLRVLMLSYSIRS